MEVRRRGGGAHHPTGINNGGDSLVNSGSSFAEANGGIIRKKMYSNGGASSNGVVVVNGGVSNKSSDQPQNNNNRSGNSVLKKTLTNSNTTSSRLTSSSKGSTAGSTKNYNNNFRLSNNSSVGVYKNVSSGGSVNRNGVGGMMMSGSVNVKGVKLGGSGSGGGSGRYSSNNSSELIVSRYEDYGDDDGVLDGDGSGSYYDEEDHHGIREGDNDGGGYQDQDDYMMDYEGQDEYDDDYDNNGDNGATAYVIDNGNDEDDEYPDTLQFCEAQFDEGCLDDDEEARGLPPPPGRGTYESDGNIHTGNSSKTRITTNECGIRIVESSTILEPEGEDDVEYDRYGDYGVTDNFIPMSTFIPSTKRSQASMYKTRKMRPEKAAAEAILRQLRNSDLEYNKSNILAKKLMGVPSQAVQPSRPPPLTKKPAKLIQQQTQASQISLESILRQKQRPQQVQISSRPKSNSLLLNNTQLKIKSSHAIPPTTSISLSTVRQQPAVSNKSLSRFQQSNDSLPSTRLQPTQPSSTLKSSLIRSNPKIQNFQQFQQANTQFRARSQGTEGASNNIPRLSISSIHQQLQSSQKNGLSMKPLKNVPRCNVCNRTFATNQVLQRHMVLHGPVATYTESDNGVIKCDVCFEEFDSTGQLAQHIQLVHSEGPSANESSPPSSSSGQQGLHRCRVCYRTFTSMESLNSHSVLHEGNLKCRACRRGFSDINSLEEHEATHKRYSCQWCTKYFMNSGNLKAHERIHTGERPYRCNDCPKAFKQLGGLQYHLKTNPSHKPQKYHKGELDGNDPGNNGSSNGDSNNSASGSATNTYIDPSMLQYESGEEYDDEGDLSILDLAAGTGF